LAHQAREVAASVDDSIPAPIFQRRKAAIALADQLFDLGEEIGVRLAAVEKRDLVPAC